MTTAYDFEAQNISGKTVALKQFEGKPLLIVNTASACGFTPQFAGLEELHKQYGGKGLVVLGFPCNQFGAQDPGSDGEIAEFCQLNYGVSFPMFEKTMVSGPRANPLYAALAQRGGGAPHWNFHKYLIDRSGNRVLGFDSGTSPADARLVREIERLLAEQSAAGAP